MALSRSMLNGMGLSAEQISAIIEAHTESTDALKAQRDEYKEKAEKNATAEKELKALKASAEEANEWKEKYEREHSEYEAFKNDTVNKETKSAKENAYKDLLKEAGVSEKRIATILKVTDLETIDLDKEGKIKNADKIAESVKTEWSDFIVTQNTEGANTSFPPSNQNAGSPDYEKMSMEEYVACRKK